MLKPPTDANIPAFLNKQDTILSEAETFVYGDREKVYGHPARHFEAVAILWTAHLKAKYGSGIEVSAEDVAWMMVQLKSARAMHAYKRDNQVDAAGYVAIVERLYESAPKPEPTQIVQGSISPIPYKGLFNLGDDNAET
jgi:hypothetical protein